MSRIKSIYISLLMIFAALVINGCDDRNIVEPRFYDADEISDRVPVIDGERIGFAIPYVSTVSFCLLGSAGEVIVMFYDNEILAAGSYTVDFDWRDANGNKYPDGLYCLLLRACGQISMGCFEYDDPEDNLP